MEQTNQKPFSVREFIGHWLALRDLWPVALGIVLFVACGKLLERYWEDSLALICFGAMYIAAWTIYPWFGRDPKMIWVLPSLRDESAVFFNWSALAALFATGAGLICKSFEMFGVYLAVVLSAIAMIERFQVRKYEDAYQFIGIGDTEARVRHIMGDPQVIKKGEKAPRVLWYENPLSDTHWAVELDEAGITTGKFRHTSQFFHFHPRAPSAQK